MFERNPNLLLLPLPLAAAPPGLLSAQLVDQHSDRHHRRLRIGMLARVLGVRLRVKGAQAWHHPLG